MYLLIHHQDRAKIRSHMVLIISCIFLLLCASGCAEEESGSVVWPGSQLCATAVHNCYDIDHAFNKSGVVTRYCSNTGEWQDPDFSQCFLKPGTKPFVHSYFTFYTPSQSHIMTNLQSIISSVSFHDVYVETCIINAIVG